MDSKRHQIMKHQIVPDENDHLKKQIAQAIRLSKKTQALYLSNLGLTSFPKAVIDSCTNLKIIDLSFNNIEVLPVEIKDFQKLEQLFLNNNPLQYLPIEISQCKSLKVLNISYTFVEFLPREMAILKNLFMLDMTSCPIKNKLKDAYDMGIVYVFKYLQRKLDRAIYRELIVKKLKEWMYMGSSYEEIQDQMQRVMDSIKDVETTNLKRLLRNMTNIFPLRIEDIEPENIREKMFQTLVKQNQNYNTTQGQQSEFDLPQQQNYESTENQENNEQEQQQEQQNSEQQLEEQQNQQKQDTEKN